MSGPPGGGSRRGSKPVHRVQFIEEDDEESPVDDETKDHDIPTITLSESTDIAETPLTERVSWTERKTSAQLHAQSRANKLASRLSSSVSGLGRASVENVPIQVESVQGGITSPYSSPPLKPLSEYPVRLDDIPLSNMQSSHERRPYDINDDTTDDDEEGPTHTAKEGKQNDVSVQSESHKTRVERETEQLVKSLTRGMGLASPSPGYNLSGSATPAIDRAYNENLRDIEYVAPPSKDQYKPSVLSSILFSKLAQLREQDQDVYSRQPSLTSENGLSTKRPSLISTRSGDQSPLDTRPQSYSYPSSGRVTPSGRRPKWYKDNYQSMSSVSTLVSNTLEGTPDIPTSASRRPSVQRKHSGMIAQAVDRIKRPSSRAKCRSQFADYAIQLSNDITDTKSRKNYLIKLCRALMMFGAPTHRMEDYMSSSSRAMLIQASYQYLPNCMIISFEDPDMSITDVHLIKQATAINLGKFKETFEVYKNVIHGVYNSFDAYEELEQIMKKPNTYPVWLLILMYGCAAISVGPFAFNARPIDLPICFALGCLIGYLQLVVAASSVQFAHVFEVFATVLTTFAARGFGSINWPGTQTPMFCFSAIAQSSIALILPGWLILSASLELQSRSLVAGSIRMVYAIIYTLFLGFGILIGSVLMGLVYPSATNTVSCEIPTWWAHESPKWHLLYTTYIWVPLFTLSLSIINQAKWKQMGAITFISCAGYITNFWAAKRFTLNVQVANACGAFVIGSLANFYSRFFHGLAAAAMLPAIFVQVPSGLAASGSLVAGLSSANLITQNSNNSSATSSTIFTNGTQGFLDAQDSASSLANNVISGGTLFNVGYGMVQVAIGISVGLFLSALVVYPFGKKRSGLFSF